MLHHLIRPGEFFPSKGRFEELQAQTRPLIRWHATDWPIKLKERDWVLVVVEGEGMDRKAAMRRLQDRNPGMPTLMRPRFSELFDGFLLPWEARALLVNAIETDDGAALESMRGDLHIEGLGDSLPPEVSDSRPDKLAEPGPQETALPAAVTSAPAGGADGQNAAVTRPEWLPLLKSFAAATDHAGSAVLRLLRGPVSRQWKIGPVGVDESIARGKIVWCLHIHSFAEKAERGHLENLLYQWCERHIKARCSSSLNIHYQALGAKSEEFSGLPMIAIAGKSNSSETRKAMAGLLAGVLRAPGVVAIPAQ